MHDDIHSRIADPWNEWDIPVEITDYGTFTWMKDGKCHRDNDLPAVIYANGTQEWYKNGWLHRDKLPAIIFYDGEVDYWVNGIQVKNG